MKIQLKILGVPQSFTTTICQATKSKKKSMKKKKILGRICLCLRVRERAGGGGGGGCGFEEPFALLAKINQHFLFEHEAELPFKNYTWFGVRDAVLALLCVR